MIQYLANSGDFAVATPLKRRTHQDGNDRIYQGADGQWYFNVRGNQAKGPFESYHDAEGALEQFIDVCTGRVRWGIGWLKNLLPLPFKRRAPSHQHF